MGDKMTPIPFGRLMNLVFGEYASSGSIFGVRRLYRNSATTNLDIFGENLDLPLGLAAGPHTQLAQNIIAGYAAGARFFELKTVQILDGHELPVSKPCIVARDECYNVEWSTELYVAQAMEEYIKAWFALKLMAGELGLSDGFVFNMSVGYDLEGIKTQKIDQFIEGLKNAENTKIWTICKEWALNNLPHFKHIDRTYIDNISSNICRSITLSTLHGCPPDEIERIAAYLLTEKSLNTFIKCNPTLLDYEYARDTLDILGFGYISFDDHHFRNDLQFEDAVPMLSRLQGLAGENGLAFGVKLTNTFPVKITEAELPGEEMYMSGRTLFPLSIEAVNRIASAFNGKIRISYSGGADVRNIGELYDAGIWPITVATTLLKPGGYQRLTQMAESLSKHRNISFDGVDHEKLQKLAQKVKSDPMYRKPPIKPPERKLNKKVPLLNCFTAPCREACPLGQDVPAYLRLAGEGDWLSALRVITQRNPLPHITGALCPQFCADKCTRAFYEEPICIRDVKHEAAKKAFDSLIGNMENVPKTGGKIAVIGGGPAGLAAAYFLSKAGRKVTVFEKEAYFGGIVRHVIPAFRISDEAIDNDIKLIRTMGAEFHANREIRSMDELRNNGFEEIIIAVGARKPVALTIEGLETLENSKTIESMEKGAEENVHPKIQDAIEFLERLKTDSQSVSMGENVVVIGGGNTALDAARACCLAGARYVTIVYRRTKRYMPAHPEELELAIRDGVKIRELLSPKSYKNGRLICEKMVLGEPDASGRRSPRPTGELTEIIADTIITAVGNTIDKELLARMGVSTEMSDNRVYFIGDALRGPSTVAEAIADALKCAGTITGVDFDDCSSLNVNPDTSSAYNKKGILCGSQASDHEQARCLECATVCLTCVDVCPNRANIAVKTGNCPQIIHIDALCNECGNCETFCPYSSAPYKDKLTLFANEEDFNNSENPGFLPLIGGSCRIRMDGETADYSDGTRLPGGVWELIQTSLKTEYL